MNYKDIPLTDVAEKLGLELDSNGLYKCWNHDDQHGSLSITDGKGFNCFVCDDIKGKTALSFVSKFYNKDYSKTTQFLNEHYDTKLLNKIKYHLRYFTDQTSNRFRFVEKGGVSLKDPTQADVENFEKITGKRYSIETLNKLGVKINTKIYKNFRWKSLAFKINYQDKSILFNPNKRNVYLHFEGRTDFMTAAQLNLESDYALVSDFNIKCRRISGNGKHIFILDSNQSPDDLRKILKSKKFEKQFKIVVLDEFEDFSDWIFNSKEITKDKVLEYINSSRFEWESIKIDSHGGTRPGSGRPSTIDTALELKDDGQIKEAIQFLLCYGIKGYTQEGRYIELSRYFLLPEFKKNGKFYYDQRKEAYYYFDNKSKELFEIPIKFDSSSKFCLYTNSKYGLNSNAAGNYLLNDLRAEALQTGHKTQIYDFLYFDNNNYRLYVNRFNGSVYCLNGKKIENIDNGTDGVLFLTSSNEPYSIEFDTEYDYDELLNVNFAHHGRISPEESTKLWRYSLLAKFSPQYLRTKPITILFGEKGSGKGVALKRIVWLIEGSRSGLLNVPKNQRDFESQLTNNDYVFYDNLDEYVEPWFKEGLASAATGYQIQLARLYQTNTKASFTANPFIGIASRTAKFVEERDDISDRALIFHVTALPTKISEEELYDHIIKNRNKIMSALLQKCNSIITALKSNSSKEFKTNFRMADFAKFVALGFPKDWSENKVIFEKMMNVQSDLAAENSMLYDRIFKYLDQSNSLEGSISNIYDKLYEFCSDTNIKFMKLNTFRCKFRSQISSIKQWFNVIEENQNIEGIQPRWYYKISLSQEDLESTYYDEDEI